MQYVMASKWSLMERFEITDGSGTPQFEARGHFGSKITLHDYSGQEVAEIRKHMMSDKHDIYVGGRQVAEVKHEGFFGDHYDIQSGYGTLTARGHFNGGDYTLSRDGAPVAAMRRQFSLREKFGIDIADNEDPAFLLAVILAIEAIHEERNQQGHHEGMFGMGGPGMGGGIGGIGGGIGGMLGGNFP
jgi:uncharacterized protein YxjI